MRRVLQLLRGAAGLRLPQRWGGRGLPGQAVPRRRGAPRLGARAAHIRRAIAVPLRAGVCQLAAGGGGGRAARVRARPRPRRPRQVPRCARPGGGELAACEGVVRGRHLLPPRQLRLPRRLGAPHVRCGRGRRRRRRRRGRAEPPPPRGRRGVSWRGHRAPRRGPRLHHRRRCRAAHVHASGALLPPRGSRARGPGEDRGGCRLVD
mmetsp:Transcript_43411/g.138519  ORF Transcript_43411/g.138519 Transcript_43411/m.138519 type:complete len:206 (+) Transcript_43411:1549-2166(+)